MSSSDALNRKQLQDPKTQVVALTRLHNEVLSGIVISELLTSELERLLIEGDTSSSTKELLYLIARTAFPNRLSLLHTVTRDLEGNDDAASLSAACDTLACISSRSLFLFFARPTDGGGFSCEGAAATLTRVLSHADPLVRSGAAAGLTHAAARVWAQVATSDGLCSWATDRGGDSWGAALRLREVVQDKVAEVVELLIEGVIGGLDRSAQSFADALHGLLQGPST